jgi:molybdenum cofactor cytidylyltransferase
MKIHHPGIIISAAGRSSRLGRPKQLLPFGDGNLITHAVATANDAARGPVAVVLGAYADVIIPYLSGLNTSVVINPDWPSGMASSIRTGIGFFEENYPETDGLLFMVCDQPWLTQSVISGLFSLQNEQNTPAAACIYAGAPGTPALFHKSVFQALKNLKGDRGAGKLLREMSEVISKLDFPEGLHDIDTEDEYRELLKRLSLP